MRDISQQQAFELAAAHVANMPLDHPDYRMDCEFECQLSGGWLFQYRIKQLRELPSEQQEQFAGAAAFIVSMRGDINGLSVPMYIELKKSLGTLRYSPPHDGGNTDIRRSGDATH